MFTKDDLSIELINSSDIYFINIIIDFLNNFYNTYKILTKEEIKEAINKLEYIGFSKNQYKIDSSEHATFGRGIYYYIALNNHYLNSDISVHKSYLYHELIHCLSSYKDHHKEVNGLNKDHITIFDEIMTEYYSQILLMNENINNYHIQVYEEDSNYKLYSSYYGNGYHLYMPLAKIYDYVFQNDLIRAKFINQKIFNKYFNELLKKIDINDFDYDSFINETDYKIRYYQITELFIKYLIYLYNNNGIDIKLMFNDKNISYFIELLNKEKINNIIMPNRELCLYIYDLINNNIYKEKKLII